MWCLKVDLHYIFFREVSLSDIAAVEKRLMQAMEMIVIKKKRIAIARRQSLEKPQDSLKRGLWSMFSISSNKNVESKIDRLRISRIYINIFGFSDISQLKLEIRGLEELSRQMFLEANEKHNMLERMEWSQTWKGRYFDFLGHFFSLYCVWKIFIVSSTHVIYNVYVTSI